MVVVGGGSRNEPRVCMQQGGGEGGRVEVGLEQRRYYAVKIKEKCSNANIFGAFCHLSSEYNLMLAELQF